MAGSYYNTAQSRMPYAGPNRNMEGDPAFEAWRQRQFSTQPFSGPDDPLFKMPTVPGTAGGGSQPWKDPASWDPRSITQSDAYKRLMAIAGTGSGAPANARQGTAPAMDFYQKALASGDPLGTQMLPELQFQRSMGAVRDAGQTARRQINESAGGLNAASNPAMLQFMQVLAGMQGAQGIGDASRAESETRIQERSATKSFQEGVAQAMAQLQAMLGGLDISDANLMSGAAGGALTSQSYANNTWAQLMQQLLMQSMRPGPTLTPAQRGRGDMNPYPSPGDLGTLQGSQASNPFALMRQAWLADKAPSILGG